MLHISEKVSQLARYYRFFGLRGAAYRVLRQEKQKSGARVTSLPADERKGFEERGNALKNPPLISVILPVCDPPEAFLEKALQSVIRQSYAHFELCVADDSSTNPRIREILEKYERTNKRVRCIFRGERGHIVEATRSAIQLSSGQVLCLFDHDDLLIENALFEVAREFSQQPSLDVVYSDEYIINSQEKVRELARKPAWSPFYFYHYMYIGHLVAFRREIFDKVGGLSSIAVGSQDYDLLLRMAQAGAAIFHIPKPLYCWRAHGGSAASHPAQKGYALEAAKRSLQTIVASRAISVSESVYPGVYRYVPKKTLEYEIFRFQEGEFAHTLRLASESSAPFVILQHEQIVFDPFALRRLGADISLPRVGIVSCVLYSAVSKKVLEAGYSVRGNEIFRNFSNTSIYEAGKGMRLWSGYDVLATSGKATAFSTRLLKEALECSVALESERAIEFAISLQVRKLGYSAACSGLARAKWSGGDLPGIECFSPEADYHKLLELFPSFRALDSYHPPLQKRFGFQS